MPLSSGVRGGATPTLGHSNSKGTGGRALVVLVVVSVVLFTASVRGGEAGPLNVVRGGFQTVTMPVRYLGAAVAAPFQGVGNILHNLTADTATLSELETENAELRTRNAELEESAQTAARLQGLLDLQSTYSLKSTAARVISGSPDSWSSTVTIDKGTATGVAEGMPVMGSTGAIGQIVEAGPVSSTVRLLTDESSSVAAMIQSNRAQGMLNGSATGQLTLTLIRSGQEVKVGDIVVTSGLGGVFPKGLPLGKVTSVESNPGSMYLDIVVEPFAHTETNEEVLVITSLTEEQKASAEDIAAADAQEKSGGATTATADGSSSTSSSTDQSTSTPVEG